MEDQEQVVAAAQQQVKQAQEVHAAALAALAAAQSLASAQAAYRATLAAAQKAEGNAADKEQGGSVDPAPAKPRTAPRKPRAASVRDTGTGEDDGARFLRVREGVEAGRIKPSIRAIYAAEGASQPVARRYLLALEQAGVIEQQGRGYRLIAA